MLRSFKKTLLSTLGLAKWLLDLNSQHYLKPGIRCMWSDVQSRQPLRQALIVICKPADSLNERTNYCICFFAHATHFVL